MEALWPPAGAQIARQPDQRLFKPEDLEKYAEGSLRGFLLHLDEDQQRFIDWALKGPILVRGGPGAGKSTLALYRVRAIIEQGWRQGAELPEILFTTYTNALINFSESLMHQLLSDPLKLKAGSALLASIRVTTVDSTIMWIARHSGQKFKIANPEDQLEALRHARASLKPQALGAPDRLPLAPAFSISGTITCWRSSTGRLRVRVVPS